MSSGSICIKARIVSCVHLSALSPAPGISPRSCRCPCRCPCPRPPRPRLRSWPLLTTLPAVFTSQVSSAKSVSTCNFVTIAAMSPTAGAGLLRVLCLPFLDHNKNKLQSHPKQCVSILFQRIFYFLRLQWKFDISILKNVFPLFIWVLYQSAVVSVVNVEYFLNISCWCSDVPDTALPRYKPLLSPDDKMLTIIGDKTLGLAMARCVYWAKDLSVSGPMISDCSQYIYIYRCSSFRM